MSSQTDQPTNVLKVFQADSAVGLPLPEYATAGAAGLDLIAALHAGEPLQLAPGERALVPTGLHLEIPEGFEGQVRARSGLASKHGIGLVNSPGTIDSDYRGELRILLINWGSEPYTIHRGDRIAQLVIAAVCKVNVTVSSYADLGATQRDHGGFGSTGCRG